MKSELNSKLAVSGVDVLIESTEKFENELGGLSEAERTAVVKSINECASQFPAQSADGYCKLHSLYLPLGLDGYESSLYVLEVSQKIRIVLSIDEDPIFNHVVLTLFRAVEHDDFDAARKDVAESLYQELLHRDHEPVPIA